MQIRALLTAIVLAVGLVSPAGAATEITYWHYQTGNKDAMRQMLDAFEAENPDIKVRDVFKDNSAMATEVQAAALAGRTPDVAQILSRLYVGLIKNAGAIPLDGDPQLSGFIKDLLPQFVDIGRYEGHVYGVPQSYGTPLLYLNRNLFRQAGLDPDKPPRTWQELVEQGRIIKEKTGKFALYVPLSGRDVAPQQFMMNAGADMMDDKLTKATFATPESIEAMQMWQDMVVKYGIYSELSDREQLALFNGGNIAMMVTSVASFQGTVRDTQGRFELGIANYPTWKNMPRRVPNSGSGLMVFSKDPAKRAASLKLLAYLARPEVSNHWAIISGYLPIVKEPKQDATLVAYLKQEPRWEVAVNQMAQTVATARWPGDRVVDIQIVLENLVQDMFHNKGPAATLVPRAQADITKIIAESGD